MTNARIFSGLLIAAGAFAGCSSKDDEYDSESHFTCEDDADCEDEGNDLACVEGECRSPGREPDAQRAFPLKNGIPVGDCEEPTAASLTAAGCPPEPPGML